jgi:2-isopropylmalate synthase
VPYNKAIVGRNAFRHASGIHQDGVLKKRETYEVIDPAWIGHPVGSEIVLGKLSGRAGFASRVARLGLVLDEAELERAFRDFQRVAAATREMSDEELRGLCRPAARGWPARGAGVPRLRGGRCQSACSARSTKPCSA